MKTIRLFGKKYRWNVEEMHPVAFWIMTIGLLAIATAGAWVVVSGMVIIPHIIAGA